MTRRRARSGKLVDAADPRLSAGIPQSLRTRSAGRVPTASVTCTRRQR